jgi:predicted transglutaminase-like cysteine proteinase
VLRRSILNISPSKQKPLPTAGSFKIRTVRDFCIINLRPKLTKALFSILFTLSTLAVAIEFQPRLFELVTKHFGKDAVERLIAWQDLAKNTSGSDIEKLTRVNDFFNKARFVSDKELWKAEDYWATPVELLARNAGDCEDYAIAKYFTLIAQGVEEDKLQISYVKAIELGQAHMVLAYYETPESIPLILDNIDPLIKPADQRPDLEPVYSFNGRGLWLSRFSKENAKRLSGPEKIDSWNDMIRRQGVMLMAPNEPEN